MCWKSMSLCALSVLFAAASPRVTDGADPLSQVVRIDQLPLRSHVDLGQHSPGEEVKVAIELRSDLGKPLSIHSITPDCGCLDVKHDPKQFAANGSLMIHLRLSPSRKLGRIRRNLRFFFEQERTSPLDVGIDTRIVGPIGFDASTVSVGKLIQSIELTGTKSGESVELLSCEPLRSTCRVISIDQTNTTFQVRVQPLFAFGSAHELFRIGYREGVDAEPAIVELPLEFKSVSPLRFLPSATQLRFNEETWRAVAKLVVAPAANLDFERLQISIEREDGSPFDQADYRVDLSRTSIVLYAMHVRCTASRHDLDRPARLKVASPNGELLATLDFFSP